jgi:hypothetical protein
MDVHVVMILSLPYILHTRPEVLSYTNTELYIYNASSCNGFCQTIHSSFWTESNTPNRLTFSKTLRPALGTTRSPIQRVPGVPSLGVKRLGHEGDHSPPSSAEGKKCVELHTPTPHTYLHDMHRDFAGLYFSVHC